MCEGVCEGEGEGQGKGKETKYREHVWVVVHFVSC